jgi:hypothetical protein
VVRPWPRRTRRRRRSTTAAPRSARRRLRDRELGPERRSGCRRKR